MVVQFFESLEPSSPRPLRPSLLSFIQPISLLCLLICLILNLSKQLLPLRAQCFLRRQRALKKPRSRSPALATDACACLADLLLGFTELEKASEFKEGDFEHWKRQDNVIDGGGGDEVAEG